MKLWHRDPPLSPKRPVCREDRDARMELLITAVIACLGVLGLIVSSGG